MDKEARLEKEENMSKEVTRQEIETLGMFRGKVLDETHRYYWVRLWSGTEMSVLKGDESLTPCLTRDFYWESWITAWFINHIEPATVFYDIGANCGYYSFLAYDMGAMVHAFEPNPDYHIMLSHTAAKAGMSTAMNIYPVALSDHRGKATLNIPLTLHGSASLNDIDAAYETKQVEVNLERLDYLRYGTTAESVLLKIDAEGEEERILAGAQDFLDRTNNPVIMMEFTPGAYSDEFIPGLREDWQVNWIDYESQEVPASDEWLDRQKDWRMLVLRRK